MTEEKKPMVGVSWLDVRAELPKDVQDHLNAKQAYRRLELWFFRDLTDDQRLTLFRLYEMPVDEIRSLGHQRLAFQHIFKKEPQ